MANLLNNSSFISGTTGWVGLALSGSTPTIATDSSDPLYGTGYSAKITFQTSSPNSGIVTDNAYSISVNAGQNYTFSAYVKVPVGQATSDFSLRAYFDINANGAGGTTSLDSLKTTISSYDGWVRLTYTFTVPATYNYFRGFIYRSSNTSVSSGYNFLVDAVQLETGSEASSLVYDQGQKNKLVDTSLTNVYIDHLKGMKLKADIRLGDFVFNRIDEYGVVWVVTNVQGWNNLPDVQMQNFDRGWGDGSFISYGRYGAREITIEGSFLVQDVDKQLEPARERLLKAINLVKNDNWLIMNETVPKGVKVRLLASPDIATINSRGRTDFSFTLIAADPIKYKWDDARDDGYKLVTINNSPTAYTTVRNDGNTPVPVNFEIIGPTTGPISIFNKTSEELLEMVSKLGSYVVNPVTSVSVTNNVATITTSNATGLAVNDTVELINIVDIFEVDKAQIPTSSTITLTMREKHNFSVNQRINIANLSSVTGFSGITDGEYPITTVYSSSDEYKLTITKAAGGLTTKAETNVSANAISLSVLANVSSVIYSSANNLATYTTSQTHGFKVGDTVVISNTTPIYDGTYTIDDIPSTTTFAISLYPTLIRRVVKYTSTYNSVTAYITTGAGQFPVLADDYIYISSLGIEYDGVYKVSSVSVQTVSGTEYTLVTYEKDIKNPQNSLTNSTYATIQIQSLGADRSLASVTGKAFFGNRFNGKYDVSTIYIADADKFSVPVNLGYDVPSRVQNTFNDITSNYEVRRYNEIINIDTLNREIALNGEIGGYRSRLETIVDWIYLQPGDNEINFTDKNKIYVSSVSYDNATNTATIVTKTNHYLQPQASIVLSGLNVVNGTVFADGTVTVNSVPNTQSITFNLNSSYGSNISSTDVTTGHIYEVSSSYLNIYYRSGWIG